MATTVQTIINAAYAKSAKNRPQQLADDLTELLPVVRRLLQKYFARAAKINWRYFGKKLVVAYDGTTGGWPFPTDAASVRRLEQLVVDAYVPVVEVPSDNRTADLGRKAVYALGRAYYGAGNDGDPASGNLTFHYAKKPRSLTALTGDPNGTLDTAWEEDFNDLLILGVARHLARKQGGRADEVADLDAEIQAWESLFDEHVAQYTDTMTESGAL